MIKLTPILTPVVFAVLTLSAQAQQVNTSSGVEQVLSASMTQNKKDPTSEVAEIRKTALIDIASSYGVSSGLSWKLKKIKDEEITRMEARLDNLYNFSRLAIDNGVLPPVLEEGQSNYAQDSTDEVRISDKTFKIVSNAKFVSVYPTWRNYLNFNVPTYEAPPRSFLPQNAAESALWDEWAKKGWESGVQQAMTMFQSSLDRIDRDYNGMLKFKTLLAQGLITKTIISKQNLGVTGGGREMAINDQIFRIVDHSALVPNQKEWKVQYPITYKDAETVK